MRSEWGIISVLQFLLECCSAWELYIMYHCICVCVCVYICIYKYISSQSNGSQWTKLVEVMGFQLSCCKSYKNMLLNCCTQHAIKSAKLSSGQRAGKGQFSFQSQRKAIPKKVWTIAQLCSSHMLAKKCSNSPSQASTVYELWASRSSSCI